MRQHLATQVVQKLAKGYPSEEHSLPFHQLQMEPPERLVGIWILQLQQLVIDAGSSRGSG